MNPKYQISDWPCSWEEHELVELRDGMRRSFRDKLIWLEEATAFAKRLQATSPRTHEISPAYGEGESNP
jgi:hypothetical protein